MDPLDKKSQKYFDVSRAILEIIDDVGLDNLSHSEVSRKAQVSRAWIYEYMGKEKADLIKIAADTFSRYFSQNNISNNFTSKAELEKYLIESHELAMSKLLENPIIIKLYFRFKGTKTPIGDAISKYENYWLEIISENIVRCLSFQKEDALSASYAVLVLRLGFYHRIAVSFHSIDEINLAKKVLESAYKKIIG